MGSFNRHHDMAAWLTWYLTPGRWLALRIWLMLSAAFTGTVLFSTTILELVATSAILRAADSMYFRSAALPYESDLIPITLWWLVHF